MRLVVPISKVNYIALNMNLVKSFLFVAIAMVLFSCQDTPGVPIEQPHFFDLKAFFSEEMERLKNVNKLNKKALIDGNLEEKTIEGIDLKKELALFVDSDINKVSWLDKYETDSTFNKEVLTQITYKAKDERLKTNRLAVHFEQGKVDSIEIIRKSSSLAAELEQYLIYLPAKGYSIESRQKTSFSKAHVLKLDVLFVP